MLADITKWTDFKILTHTNNEHSTIGNLIVNKTVRLLESWIPQQIRLWASLCAIVGMKLTEVRRHTQSIWAAPTHGPGPKLNKRREGAEHQTPPPNPHPLTPTFGILVFLCFLNRGQLPQALPPTRQVTHQTVSQNQPCLPRALLLSILSW